MSKKKVPKYCYRCSECDKEFFIRHSIKDKLTHCNCEKKGKVMRIPMIGRILKNKTKENKAGEKVKQFIEETKKELKEEKKSLSGQEYDA